MKKRLDIVTLFSLFLLLAGIAACNVEPRFSGEVSPQIDMSSAKGLSDVSDYFTIEKIRLKATGSGINEEWSFTKDDDKVVISLPEADNVLFELFLGGLVLTYRGTTRADLKAGEKTEISFDSFVPYDTKILVPDYGAGGSPKIVQIDDFNAAPGGSGWEEKDLSGILTDPDTGLALDLVPMDIEVDNYGQIWIAGDATGGIFGVTHQVPFEESEFFPVVVGEQASITSLAYDRANEYMYYIEGWALKRIDTGFYITDEESIPEVTPEIFDSFSGVTTPSQVYPFGLAVDNEGYVYFAGEEGAASPVTYIFKMDPSDGSIVATSAAGDLPDSLGGASYDYPDLLYKEGYIYVTNQHGGGGKQILRFDTDLNSAGSFGETTDDPSAEKAFFGPSRFVATLKKNIYVIDEGTDDAGNDVNRLVGFSDINGSDWDTYRPQDGNEFYFYY